MKKNNAKLLKLVNRFKAIRNNFVQGYEEISQLRDDVKKDSFTLEELVNRIYAVRECSRYLDDLRKEMDAICKLMENMTCAKWTMTHLNRPEKAGPIKAQFATGTPKNRMGAKIPKKKTDPDRYFALMEFFGMPASVAEREIFRVNWPSFCDYFSDLMEEGKPVPPGIKPDETYPIYSVNIYARRPLDEVIGELEDATGDEEIEEVLTKFCDVRN